MYKILSFDGGGTRGVLSAVILDRLVKSHPTLLDKVNLVTGTSTGGILALGIAAGLQPKRLVDFYLKDAAIIFGKKRHVRNLFGLIGPLYSNAALKDTLTKYLKGQKLSDLPKSVVIPSFALASPNGGWKPKVFHNLHLPLKLAKVNSLSVPMKVSATFSEDVIDVAMRTSAAPIFFPSYQEYVDGGFVANNPSMLATTLALESHDLSEIAVLSLGTGHSQTSINGHDHQWGLAQWGIKIINLFLEAPMEIVDYQCSKLLKERYMRVSPIIPPMRIDDTKKLGDLVRIAKQLDLSNVNKWIDTIFNS